MCRGAPRCPCMDEQDTDVTVPGPSMMMGYRIRDRGLSREPGVQGDDMRMPRRNDRARECCQQHEHDSQEPEGVLVVTAGLHHDPPLPKSLAASRQSPCRSPGWQSMSFGLCTTEYTASASQLQVICNTLCTYSGCCATPLRKSRSKGPSTRRGGSGYGTRLLSLRPTRSLRTGGGRPSVPPPLRATRSDVHPSFRHHLRRRRDHRVTE